VGLDRVAHLREVAVHDLDDELRLLGLGEAREPAQVAEHHGAVAPDAADAQVVVDAVDDLVHDLRRDEA
jgi:hypothetical protein